MDDGGIAAPGVAKPSTFKVAGFKKRETELRKKETKLLHKEATLNSREARLSRRLKEVGQREAKVKAMPDALSPVGCNPDQAGALIDWNRPAAPAKRRSSLAHARRCAWCNADFMGQARAKYCTGENSLLARQAREQKHE